MNELLSIVLTIITAATPLLLASIGELVVERSGVLNLGVEGMMAVGAVCGFGAALMTGSPLVGVLAAIAAGVILSMLFGFLTLTMVSNQVATGLALTLLGLAGCKDPNAEKGGGTASGGGTSTEPSRAPRTCASPCRYSR